MRNQRPRDRVKCEIIILVARPTGGGGNVEGQDELTALAGVMQEWWRSHVGRRRLRRFGRGCKTNDRRAARQRDEILRCYDLLDLVQSMFVERQDGIARDLLLLQLPNYCAVIAARIAVGLGNLRGKRRHLCLILRECCVRHRRDLLRGNVNAVFLKGKRVLLRRQAKVGSRFGQNVLANPGVVIRQLLLQFRVRTLPVSQPVLGKKRADALNVIRIAPEFRLDFILGRVDDTWFGHLDLCALLEQRNEWLISALLPGVLAQPGNGGWPSLRCNLVIEQDAQALKYPRTGIEKRDFVLEGVVFLSKLQVECLVKDVQILTDSLVRLARARRLGLC